MKHANRPKDRVYLHSNPLGTQPARSAGKGAARRGLRPRRTSRRIPSPPQRTAKQTAIAVGTAQSLANPQYPRLLCLRPVCGAPALPPARPPARPLAPRPHPRNVTSTHAHARPLLASCKFGLRYCVSAAHTSVRTSNVPWRWSCSARRGNGEHHS